jgi:UDP-glucuronate 4-epimerase
MSRQSILVTGAAGFIGSHVAEALLRQGHNVVGVDNFCDFYDRAWKEANVRDIGTQLRMEELDIVDAPAIERLIATVKPAAILHLAAMAGVRPSIENPPAYARVNLEGTTNMLQAAVRHGVGRFLFASSSSVYGNNSRVPFSEDEPVGEPISPYAATKRAGELMCHAFWHLYRLPCFCLRFFTVYGPRQRPDLAIHKFTRLITQARPIPFYGDGSTSRDYTYIDDIVEGVLRALERCDRYRIYNLGGCEPVSLRRLVDELQHVLGTTAVLDHRPPQPGDVERTCADLARSAAELGYAPRTPLPEGLQHFAKWFHAHRQAGA